MAIQSAINNMLGTAGTVAAISEHLGKQKEANKEMKENRILSLEEEELKNKEKQMDLAKELDQSLEAQNELKEDVKSIDESVTGMYSTVSDKKLRVSKGQFYSEKAFENLEDARASKEAGISRLNGVIRNIQDKQMLNSNRGLKIRDMLEEVINNGK